MRLAMVPSIYEVRKNTVGAFAVRAIYSDYLLSQCAERTGLKKASETHHCNNGGVVLLLQIVNIR